MDSYSILIVDDEIVLHELVEAALSADGFVFRHAYDGEEALALIAEEQPDLIISDMTMPRIDGCELIRRVKGDIFRRHIPMIMLTSQNSEEATVAGLESGADDYVAKPFRSAELKTRMLTQLRRRERDLYSDPLTQLPSGVLIRRELNARIERGIPFAAVYSDLDHFKPVVDKYGFVRAGDVVKKTADILYRSVLDTAGAGCFVGHIAGDDFIAVCPPDVATRVCEEFIRRFDAVVPSFYNPIDVERGYIEGRDREGHARTFALLSVSLCVVDSRKHELKSASDVAHLAFGARTTVKAMTGSAFIIV